MEAIRCARCGGETSSDPEVQAVLAARWDLGEPPLCATCVEVRRVEREAEADAWAQRAEAERLEAEWRASARVAELAAQVRQLGLATLVLRETQGETAVASPDGFGSRGAAWSAASLHLPACGAACCAPHCPALPLDPASVAVVLELAGYVEEAAPRARIFRRVP